MAWFSVIILLVVAISSYLDRQIIALMVEPIRASLGVSDFQIGLLQGVAFGLFYAAFGLPIGWLVDRFSRRRIIYLGMTLWSLAAASCGLASTYWQLLLARFGVGVGEASLSPAAYSMIADLFPPRRLALALGVFAAGSSIGGAIAYMAGGVLIAWLEARGATVLPLIGAVQPWQMVFLMTGLPGLVLATLVLALREPRRTHAKAASDGIDDGFLRFLSGNRRYFLCHFLGFGLLAVLAYGSAAWAPAMLMRRYGMDVAHVGMLMGTISLVMGIPGFLFSGWFVDRWFAAGCRDAHLRYFVYACLIGAAAAVVAFGFATSLWVFVPAYALLHFLQPFTGPAVAHLQMATPGDYRGRISALFVLVFNLMGMCLGPPSVAFMTDFIFKDPAKVNLSLLSVYVATALLAALLFRLGLGPARRMVASA
jgi:MFS family permease